MRNHITQQHDGHWPNAETGAALAWVGKPHAKPSPTSSSQPMQDLSVSFSHENIVWAARMLKRKRTLPGVDGVDPKEYFKSVIERENLRDKIRDLVFDRSFRPSPYRIERIPKGN